LRLLARGLLEPLTEGVVVFRGVELHDAQLVDETPSQASSASRISAFGGPISFASRPYEASEPTSRPAHARAGEECGNGGGCLVWRLVMDEMPGVLRVGYLDVGKELAEALGPGSEQHRVVAPP
jgi:hypothetical protein